MKPANSRWAKEAQKMKCEEFAMVGLDAETSNGAESAAAREHASVCSNCAALLDSWQAVRGELALLKEEQEIDAMETPARVELRLRLELRSQQERKMHGTRMIAVWTLLAAVVVISAVGWQQWSITTRRDARRHESPAVGVSAGGHRDNDRRLLGVASSMPQENVNAAVAVTQGVESEKDAQLPTLASAHKPVGVLSPAMLSPSAEGGDFTALPGSLDASNSGDAGDDEAIVQVRMPRGALGALGLPVNEERAGEVILVDLLVRSDGLPEAVRLR
ncbi:MAG: hypothetical protein NVS9B4_16510 [Candidatus Acidiferrum sp.]